MTQEEVDYHWNKFIEEHMWKPVTDEEYFENVRKDLNRSLLFLTLIVLAIFTCLIYLFFIHY